MARSSRLHRLQRVDDELQRKSARLAEVKDKLAGSEALQQARTAVEQQQGDLARLEKELRRQELNLQEVEDKIESEEERLYSGEITGAKEFTSLQDEIAYLRNRRSSLDEAILELMVSVEEGQEALDRKEERLTTVKAARESEKVELQVEKEELEARLAELKDERKRLVSQVSDRTLRKYQALRDSKGGIGVALVENGLCQGCRVGLPSHMIDQVRDGDTLVFCDNCGRILHHK